MTKNSIIIAVVSIVAIFGFLIVVYKLISSSTNNIFSQINMIKAHDHLKWSADKKNILVEYSDVQCSACKIYHDLLKSFEATSSPEFAITQKITLVYRHFPLYQIHSNAFESAYAIEAAGRQGKFFEMLDLAFDKQVDLTRTTNTKTFFIDLAKKLGLDINQFQTDIDSKQVKDKVTNDLASGEKAGINATPTFFLNGKKLEFKTIAEFKKLLK